MYNKLVWWTFERGYTWNGNVTFTCQSQDLKWHVWDFIGFSIRVLLGLLFGFLFEFLSVVLLLICWSFFVGFMVRFMVVVFLLVFSWVSGWVFGWVLVVVFIRFLIRFLVGFWVVKFSNKQKEHETRFWIIFILENSENVCKVLCSFWTVFVKFTK